MNSGTLMTVGHIWIAIAWLSDSMGKAAIAALIAVLFIALSAVDEFGDEKEHVVNH